MANRSSIFIERLLGQYARSRYEARFVRVNYIRLGFTVLEISRKSRVSRVTPLPPPRPLRSPPPQNRIMNDEQVLATTVNQTRIAASNAVHVIDALILIYPYSFFTRRDPPLHGEQREFLSRSSRHSRATFFDRIFPTRPRLVRVITLAFARNRELPFHFTPRGLARSIRASQDTTWKRVVPRNKSRHGIYHDRKATADFY